MWSVYGVCGVWGVGCDRHGGVGDGEGERACFALPHPHAPCIRTPGIRSGFRVSAFRVSAFRVHRVSLNSRLESNEEEEGAPWRESSSLPSSMSGCAEVTLKYQTRSA